MAYVTTSTIYQTIFMTVIMLVGKGWLIARSTLSRKDSSKLTVFMAITYLFNSAYYVSLNAP